jgi:EAL domain-containing protein (putative c-di-GMP-specific phosphodiesterase class I)
LDRQEFLVYYQPIVSISTEEVAGFEALVRWQHPKRSMILPTRFISLAEECGVISPLGRWVLLEACRRANEWCATGSVGSGSIICVNVSAAQLQQATFVSEVASTLRETGLDPCRLVLEITEGTMMQDPVWTANTLTQLKGLGLRIAIDDFGTGYSSLSSLRQFPFDILKIDKSFIDRVAESTPEQKLARTIIDLGKTLNVQVIAEGIESPEQLSALRSLGCDLGQGFYFARPMSTDDVTAFLRSQTLSDAA